MAAATTSDYLYQRQLNHILKNDPWTPPTILYVALFTGGSISLSGSGGATEVPINPSTNYARVSYASSSTAWSIPSGPNLSYTNSGEIVFPVPGVTSWGTITSCAIYDAATGGNLLWVGTIGTSKPVSTGDGAPRILINQLIISRAA